MYVKFLTCIPVFPLTSSQLWVILSFSLSQTQLHKIIISSYVCKALAFVFILNEGIFVKLCLDADGRERLIVLLTTTTL